MVSKVRQTEMPDLLKKYRVHKQKIPRFVGQSLNQVVVYTDVLAKERFHFEAASNTPWQVDPQLAAHVDALLNFHRPGAQLYRGVMSRLVDFTPVRVSGDIRMKFRPSSYFNYVATNLSMECIPPGWTQSIRNKFEPGPELSQFSASKCDNHLGLSALLVTRDGRLIVPERTADVSSYPEMTSPSASGGFEFEDVSRERGPQRGQPDPFRGILSEIREELAVESSEVDLIFFIGLSRELARGGKPEMFFYCESSVEEQEIELRIRRGEGRDATVENKCRHYYPLSGLSSEEQKDLLERIARDTAEGAKPSPPLKMALYFLHRHLDALRSKGARMLQ